MAKQKSRSAKTAGARNPVMLLLAVVGVVGSAAIAGLWVLPKISERSTLTAEATTAETELEVALATMRGLNGECAATDECAGDEFSVTKARTDKADAFVEFLDTENPAAASPDALKVIALARVEAAATNSSTDHTVGLSWTAYKPAGMAPSLVAVSFPVTLKGSAAAPRDFIKAATDSGLVVTIISADVGAAGVIVTTETGAAPPTTAPPSNGEPPAPGKGAVSLSETESFDWVLTIALWYSSEPGVKSPGELDQTDVTSPPASTPVGEVQTTTAGGTDATATERILAAVAKLDAEVIATSNVSQTASNAQLNVETANSSVGGSGFAVALAAPDAGIISSATLSDGTCSIVLTFGTDVGQPGIVGDPTGC